MSRRASADDGGAVPPPRNEAPAGEGTRPPSDDESPGVPGFHTWRGVYWFVLVWFAVCVAGLTWLTHLT